MNARTLFSTLCSLPALLLLLAAPAAAQNTTNAFAGLAEGTRIHGFRSAALYLNDENVPMGARFVHERTGFTFDVLSIQSVPQGYIWVNSYPTSDMGEPHTQEHLLLGKGNVGRFVANLEGMSLSTSSAYTRQWQTCYFFNTAAGGEAYYEGFEARLNALLHPDYTDEEIRREVCNFGVTADAGTGKLRIEEKGTVYNEMVSSFERSWSLMSRKVDIATYGEHHPLAYVSGGLPEAIRRMTPADIRKFHHDNYRLDNMGMIGAFPREMPLEDVLSRTDTILNRLEPQLPEPLTVITAATLPAPAPAPAGQIFFVDYPNSNEKLPSPLLFAWPARLDVAPQEQLLLNLFLDNVASDETSNLYRLFIDSKKKKMDVGATGVFGWSSTDQGHPIYMGLSDVPQEHLNEATVKSVRSAIMQEIARIADMPDGSEELREFNDRIRNRIVAQRRSLAKLVNSPPGFGFRFTSSAWLDHLADLSHREGFRKSVTLRPELDAIEKQLAAPANPWRTLIDRWKLTSTEPTAGIPKPSAALVKREADERKARADAEIARLKNIYHTADEQSTIARYRREYDSTTAVLDRLAAQAAHARFIDNPPMTLDDQLDFVSTKVADDVPMVTSTFENMTSATTGIALRLDGVSENDMLYLSILPTLLTSTGVYENGTAVSSEEMSRRLRDEILSLNAYYSSNWTTGRCELVVTGAGNDREESRRAVEWMRRVLEHPDWRVENLPRLRDVVDQTLNSLRNTMQGSEESWVNNPAAAWRMQSKKLMLSTESFLTRAHNAHRLKWLLKAPTEKGIRRAFSYFLVSVGRAVGTRADYMNLAALLAGDSTAGKRLPASMKPYIKELSELAPEPKRVAAEAGRDLSTLLSDVPDGSIVRDWHDLCTEMVADYVIPPSQVLENLNRVRQHLLITGGARMFMIGSIASQQYLAGPVDSLAGSLEKQSLHAIPPPTLGLIGERMLAHEPPGTGGTRPIYVGLVNPNTQSGVVINSAPSPGYRDTSRSALLEFLATKLYAGHGAHGVFMKTWAAGLAYSNGLSSSPASGRVRYYAERCPELPQTVRFVIDELKKAKLDTNLAEYAVALAFEEFRSGSSYEARGEAMAADLADGTTPGVVHTFRQAILNLRRDDPKLATELHALMPKVYGRVLPGYNTKGADVQGGIFFVIGPEKQMVLWEKYLQSVDGPSAKLFRLYPRDFWLTGMSAN